MASFDPKTTLLVMALKEESQGLFESAGIHPLYTGMGQLKAATALALQLHKQRPTQILNLGTAGSFTRKQGECVECSAFVQRHTESMGARYPKISVETAVTQLSRVVCGSADFVQNEVYKSAPEFEVMDMEAYALAFVAREFKIPFYSVKFITDSSDHNVIRDWKQNLKAGSEELLKVYQSLVIKN